jgi:hypothetical protein
MRSEVRSTESKYFWYTLVGSFVVPALLFVVARLCGFEARHAGFVVVPGAVLLVIANILYFRDSRFGGDGPRRFRMLFITLALLVLYMLSRFAGILMMPDILTEVRPPQETVITESSNLCKLVALPEAGGKIPCFVKGQSGLILFNRGYGTIEAWDILVDMKASGGIVTGIAKASGYYFPWYAFSITKGAAESEATGTVKCTFDDGKCVADASGGEQEHPDNYWSSAVIVKATNPSPDVANFEVIGAAAYDGLVTIEKVQLGGSVTAGPANLTAAVDIKMPPGSKHQCKVVRNFKYRCVKTAR